MAEWTLPVDEWSLRWALDKPYLLHFIYTETYQVPGKPPGSWSPQERQDTHYMVTLMNVCVQWGHGLWRKCNKELDLDQGEERLC